MVSVLLFDIFPYLKQKGITWTLIAAFATFDLATISYFAWNAVREVLFMIHIVQLTSFMARQHIRELSGRFRMLISRALARQEFALGPHYLEHFAAEHGRLLGYARESDREVISWVMLTTLLTNLAVNVLTIGKLLFARLCLKEQLFLWFAVGLQVALATASCGSLISWSACFNCSERLLFKAQVALVQARNGLVSGGRHRGPPLMVTAAKLKLNVFYEQICTNDEFRFTVGPLAKVSPRNMLQFAFFYSGLVMYVTKMMVKGRL